MKFKVIFASVLFIILFFSFISAEVPKMINYQGKITTPQGALIDTTVSMHFAIHVDSLGFTEPLWSETQDSVKVEKGIFSVLLGSVDTIPQFVFNGEIRYLGVTVGSDSMMKPLKPIVSVAYAYRAGIADGGANCGWVDDGTVVRLETNTDSVGIGTTSPSKKLEVTGDVLISGKATIGPGHTNTGTNAFVAGKDNTASGNVATVAGGGGNTASGTGAIIGGGSMNIASGDHATVGGGEYNTASGTGTTVCGGNGNRADGCYSIIGGGGWDTTMAAYGGVFSGFYNLAGDDFSDTAAFVGGGCYNSAINLYSTVCGGQLNTASGWSAIVCGGDYNTASGVHSTIGGGSSSTASGNGATVAGGGGNTASGNVATVGGGGGNTASGFCATIPGGQGDTVAGDYSFAAGNHVTVTSNADYTFAFGKNFTTSTPHAVIFYDAESEIKVGIQVANPTNILTVQQNSTTDPIADAWTTYSSREYKRDIHELTPGEYQEALKKIISVPVVKFHYKGEDTKEKIGVIAEEAPEEILAEGNNKAISLNEYISLLHAAMKAQQEQINVLKGEIESMKSGGQ